MDIKELLKKASGQSEAALYNEIKFLNEVRIRIISNQLRKKVDLEYKEVDWSKVRTSVEKINSIAKEIGADFFLQPDIGEIEKFLRYSLMRDIELEFKNQAQV